VRGVKQIPALQWLVEGIRSIAAALQWAMLAASAEPDMQCARWWAFGVNASVVREGRNFGDRHADCGTE
jgi:hypothetical protein